MLTRARDSPLMPAIVWLFENDASRKDVDRARDASRVASLPLGGRRRSPSSLLRQSSSIVHGRDCDRCAPVGVQEGLPRFVEQEFRDFLTCGCL